MPQISRWAISLCALAVCAGCVDRSSATGDEGRVIYSLYTSYEVDDDLRDVRIVTGHEQRIDIELTSRGSRDISSPGELKHRLRPAEGTSVDTDTHDDGSEVEVHLTVNEPGTYTLESLLGDEVMDHVDLHFAEPAGFRMNVKVREPWHDDFDTVHGNPLTVEEGSQMLLQPIPVDGDGERLAGDMSTELKVSPEWAVTPAVDVIYNSELGLWTCKGDINFYFIEPADPVTFKVTDPVSGASSSQRFVVTPVPH
jgi:hypothetical protein